MVLDMNGFLPGDTSFRTNKKKNKGCGVLFLIMLIAAGLAFVVYYTVTNNYFAEFGKKTEKTENVIAEKDEINKVGETSANDLNSMPELPVQKSAPVIEPPKEMVNIAPENKVVDSTGIMAQWKKIRELKNAKKYKEYTTLLENIYKYHSNDSHGAAALLRLGLYSRSKGDIVSAQKYWRKAYLKLPTTVSGRLSSLLLADFWYKSYVKSAVPQYERWEAIRDAYSNTIGRDDCSFISQKMRNKIIDRLIYLNKRVVFSRSECVGSSFYIVKPNDRLQTIAQKNGVHFDGIALINGIRAPQYYIRVGEKLKILKLPAEIVVDKSDMTLTLYLGGKWVKQYPVCHGGDKTIVGKYTISTKSSNPSWTDPVTKKVYSSSDRRNTLGARWLGFGGDGATAGLGIHGTTLPHSIPGKTSHGCVRMFNKDVKEIYGLALIGSVVTIKP